MEAVGAVGSIAGIIDVVGRVLVNLYQIKQQMNEADLTLLSLIGELTATKTALEQIRSFVDETLQSQEQHYQLHLDLDTSLQTCGLLMNFIDGKISSISMTNRGTLTLASRVRIALEDNSTEKYLDKLHRQLEALGMVINTFKCRTLIEQKEFLQAQPIRTLFEQVRDDSTSLMVLFDDTSFITRRSVTTAATSKLSLRFAFDNVVLGSKPYHRAFQSLLWRTERTQSTAAVKSEKMRYHIRPEEISHNLHATTSKDSLKSLGPTFRPLTVLVCGFEEQVVVATREQLEKLRCKVTTAYYWQEGEKYLAIDKKFDIHIIEETFLFSRGGDEFELAGPFRKISNTKDHGTPTVVLTCGKRPLEGIPFVNAVIELPASIPKFIDVLSKLCNWKPPPPAESLTSDPPSSSSAMNSIGGETMKKKDLDHHDTATPYQPSPSSPHSVPKTLPRSTAPPLTKAQFRQRAKEFQGDLAAGRRETLYFPLGRQLSGGLKKPDPDKLENTAKPAGISTAESTIAYLDLAKESPVDRSDPWAGLIRGVKPTEH